MDYCSFKRAKCRVKTAGNRDNLNLEVNKQLAEVYSKLKGDVQSYKIVVNKENIQVKPPKLIEIDLRNREKRGLNEAKMESNNKPLSQHSVIKKVKSCINTNKSKS